MQKKDIDFSKLHNRGERGTGRGYKWDFKPKDMIKVNCLDDIKIEFERQFSGFMKEETRKEIY